MASPPTMICKDSINAGHGAGKGYQFLFVPATNSSMTTTTPPDDGQDYSTSKEGDQGNKGIYKLWSDLSAAEYQEAVDFLVANPEKPHPQKMQKDIREAAAAAALIALKSDSDSADIGMAEHEDRSATALATADNEEIQEQEEDDILEHGRGYGRDATQHHDGEEAPSLADELTNVDMDCDQMEIDDDLRSSSDPRNDDDDNGDAATTQDQHQAQHHPHGTPPLRPGDIWHTGSVVPSVQPLLQLKSQSTLTPTLRPASTMTSIFSRSLSSVAPAWSSSPVASSPLTMPNFTPPPPQTTTTKTSTLSSSPPLPLPLPSAVVSQANNDRLKTSISSSPSPFFHAGGGGVSTPPPPQSHPSQQPEEPHHEQQLWDIGLVKALKAYDGYSDDEDEEVEEQQGGGRAQHRQHQHRPQPQRDGGHSDGDVSKLRSSSKKVAVAGRKKSSLWPEV